MAKDIGELRGLSEDEEYTDKDFIEYVENTLVPDLFEAGRDETANDFITLLDIIKSEERWLALGYQEFPSG